MSNRCFSRKSLLVVFSILRFISVLKWLLKRYLSTHISSLSIPWKAVMLRFGHCCFKYNVQLVSGFSQIKMCHYPISYEYDSKVLCALTLHRQLVQKSYWRSPFIVLYRIVLDRNYTLKSQIICDRFFDISVLRYWIRRFLLVNTFAIGIESGFPLNGPSVKQKMSNPDFHECETPAFPISLVKIMQSVD